MGYDVETLRAASDQSGIPIGYLTRWTAAEDFDPQDPEGNNTLAKQITVVFDHYAAKCLDNPDPIGALRKAGFIELADAIATLTS